MADLINGVKFSAHFFLFKHLECCVSWSDHWCERTCQWTLVSDHIYLSLFSANIIGILLTIICFEDYGTISFKKRKIFGFCLRYSQTMLNIWFADLPPHKRGLFPIWQFWRQNIFFFCFFGFAYISKNKIFNILLIMLSHVIAQKCL